MFLIVGDLDLCLIASCISVKLHLRDGWTDGQTVRPSVRPSVRSSLCPLCLSRASILWGNKPAVLQFKNINLRNIREGDKIRDQLTNTRSFVNYREII